MQTRSETTARAVLVAAGASTRMRGAGGARKPLIELRGRPLLEHTAAAFDASDRVSSLVIVTHPDDVEVIRALALTRPAFRKVVAVVAGGEERTDSVRIGATLSTEHLERDEPHFDVIAVHDGARPFVEPSAVDRAVAAAAEDGAALLALPVRDTLKRSPDGGRHATETVDRSELHAAQTPQAFRAAEFRTCLERAAAEGFRPTDDAALWERYVGPVTLVAGHPTNVKITAPEDLVWARAFLSDREETL